MDSMKLLSALNRRIALYQNKVDELRYIWNKITPGEDVSKEQLQGLSKEWKERNTKRK